ncbi:PIN domain-containing protein [Mycolicibacterium novocastrense]|uniref:PIN domain-containing protein n=1 Tax=Mycolicibacterium novocastrense TaxID=59813 RepID=UPI000E75A40F|nr:PIN domain-containing protein [Mycolicibacterium novocastrense]
MTTDRPVAGILDASVFIADKNGRQLETSLIPEQLATTVVTLAERNAGVLAARTSEIRARRLRTLDAVADMTAFPVDEEAARLWALLRVHVAEAGRRVRINDLWIAAIAAARQLPVVTQDEDFDVLEGVAGLTIVHV